MSTLDSQTRIISELIGEADDCDALCHELARWMVGKAPLYRRNDLAGDFFAKLQDAISEQCSENKRQREDAGQTALDTERDARREAREE